MDSGQRRGQHSQHGSGAHAPQEDPFASIPTKKNVINARNILTHFVVFYKHSIARAGHALVTRKK